MTGSRGGSASAGGADAAYDTFEAFVRDSAKPLLRVAWLLSGDEHAAQDLVQETHVRMAKGWPRITRDGMDPMPYARTTLYRLQVDSWRRRGRRPERLVDAVPERSGPREDEGSALRMTLMAALARLTPRQRAVLVLRFLEDRTEVQAAAVLGCSVNTVKSQTRHALQRLRELNPDLVEDLAPAGREASR